MDLNLPTLHPMDDKTKKKICRRCGTENEPGAQWCRSCQAGLTFLARMGKPWGKDGLGSRVSCTWLGCTGIGCLLLFIVPPLGFFFLFISVASQYLISKSVKGICPHCGAETGALLRLREMGGMKCFYCQGPIDLDVSSGVPMLVKSRPVDLGEDEEAIEEALAREARADRGSPAVIRNVYFPGWKGASRTGLVFLAILLAAFLVVYLMTSR